MRGVIREGVEVLDIGLVATPMLYFAVDRLGAGGGIMLTAAHNPAEYNGFKYKAFYSGSAGMDTIAKIEGYLYKNKIKEISLDEAKEKGLLKVENVIPDQLEFVENYINMDVL